MNFVSVLDQRRMNNSNAKTLMQNWVEEVSQLLRRFLTKFWKI